MPSLRVSKKAGSILSCQSTSPHRESKTFSSDREKILKSYYSNLSNMSQSSTPWGQITVTGNPHKGFRLCQALLLITASCLYHLIPSSLKPRQALLLIWPIHTWGYWGTERMVIRGRNGFWTKDFLRAEWPTGCRGWMRVPEQACRFTEGGWAGSQKPPVTSHNLNKKSGNHLYHALSAYLPHCGHQVGVK